MAHPLPEDKKAAFIGLVGGLVAILVTVLVVVQLTNRKFASHAPASPPPAAGATAPAPH